MDNEKIYEEIMIMRGYFQQLWENEKELQNQMNERLQSQIYVLEDQVYKLKNQIAFK